MEIEHLMKIAPGLSDEIESRCREIRALEVSPSFSFVSEIIFQRLNELEHQITQMEKTIYKTEYLVNKIAKRMSLKFPPKTSRKMKEFPELFEEFNDDDE